MLKRFLVSLYRQGVQHHTRNDYVEYLLFIPETTSILNHLHNPSCNGDSYVRGSFCEENLEASVGKSWQRRSYFQLKIRI